MVDIRTSIQLKLPNLIADALNRQIESQGGSAMAAGLSVKGSLPKNENNTYSFQPQQKETVPGYRKKDGTYVESYERTADPVEALTNPELFSGMFINAIREAFSNQNLYT